MYTDLFLFIIVMVIGFSLVLLAVRAGREYTLSLFAGLGVLMAFMITYPLEIFGWPILLAEALFASFFLGTDIVTDHLGKKEAKKLISIMLMGFVGTILLAKLIILLDIGGDLGGGLAGFFDAITLISALLVAAVMFIEQRLDIYLFSKIKQKTGDKKLWLRNCVSTITTQSFDVLIAYPIFLYPIFGFGVWKLMVAAAIIKIVMALLDTPLIYLSRRFLLKKI